MRSVAPFLALAKKNQPQNLTPLIMKKLLFLLIGITMLAACGDDDTDNTGTTPKASKNKDLCLHLLILLSSFAI